MNIGTGIAIIIGCLIVLLILLKLCIKFVYVRYFFMLASAVAVIASSFAMPDIDAFDLNWAAGQFISIFAFSIFTFSEIVFDKEDYIERERRQKSDNIIEITDRPKQRSMFWSVLGSSAAIAAILIVLNYIFFESAVALGIISCVALVWTIISIIKFAMWNYRSKHGPRDYY